LAAAQRARQGPPPDFERTRAQVLDGELELEIWLAVDAGAP